MSISDFVSSIMKQQGLVMNVDELNKKVTIYSYGRYLRLISQRNDSDNFTDLSDYFLEDREIDFDTNFGEDFGRVMRISLGDAFSGNIATYRMKRQSTDSKYPSSKDYENDKLGDIKSAKNVVVTVAPQRTWLECSAESLVLVQRIDWKSDFRTARGVFPINPAATEAHQIANYNYSEVPIGIRRWIEVVDGGVKVNAWFKMPVAVFQRLDLTKPVYVRELSAFFIVDEISEYQDGETPFQITLIKPNVD